MRSIVLASTILVLFAALPAAAQTDQRPRTAVPSKGLLMGSKMTVESEPCCAARPPAKSDPKDAAVIAGVRDRAHREGTILRLKLQGDRTLKITDCADENACEADRFRKHWLAAWWPDLGYYVVNVGLYESGMAFLISEKDGRATRLVAVPVRSPSGKRAVALVSDLMNGVDLELIDLSVQPPKVTVVSEMPACAGAGPNSFLRPKPVWIDETQVRFEGKPPQPGDNPNTKQLLKIIDGKPQWQC